MQWLLLSLLSLLTVFIFYQDYKTRSVIWLAFPCIFAIGIWYSLYNITSIDLLILNSSINLGFLVVQFLLLKVVFRFKKIIDSKIGTGDILFAICSCTFFAPVSFLVFYVLSLVFSLCLHFILQQINKNNYPASIPLAGLQAVFLCAFISSIAFIGSNTADDSWLLNFFY